jgi:hypothetical protein
MAERFKFAIKTPEEAVEKCQAYFDSLQQTKWAEVYDPEAGGKVFKEIPDRPKIPGLAGLAVFLGMDRRSLINWLKRDTSEDPTIAHISRVLAQAKAMIEAEQERALFDRETFRGAQFSLHVNYKWGGTEADTVAPEFQRQILPPLSSGENLAIPKWQPEGAGDE